MARERSDPFRVAMSLDHERHLALSLLRPNEIVVARHFAQHIELDGHTQGDKVGEMFAILLITNARLLILRTREGILRKSQDFLNELTLDSASLTREVVSSTRVSFGQIVGYAAGVALGREPSFVALFFNEVERDQFVQDLLNPLRGPGLPGP